MALDRTREICRTNCICCVEVKRKQDMKTPSDVNKCLREAVLQLIGLNVANVYTSPSVILTDLNNSHYVLFISINPDPEIRLAFALNVFKFELLGECLSYLQEFLIHRSCVTHEFGSPLSPVQSVKIVEEESDDDDIYGADSKVFLSSEIS